MDVLYFLHEIVVYRHFFIFQYGFQNGRQNHVTILIMIGSNKCFIYKQHSVKKLQQ